MDKFVLLPDEYANHSFRELLQKIRKNGNSAVISLQPGRYLFHKNEAEICDQPVSNTVVYDGSVPHKHVGLLLDGISDLIMEGNGTELVFDGDMSAIALLRCRNIVLRNFSVDYLHPRIAEMRCTACHGKEAEFELHPDSRAFIRDGKLFFLNPDGIPEPAEKWIVQCASADGDSNKRSPFHPYAEAAESTETAPGKFKFRYNELQNIEIGSVWQFRNPTRNENGIFLHKCENVELDHLQLNFTPGLGVIAQLCKDLKIRHHIHAPKPGSGRVCAAFADCIQISSCRGKVQIADSKFSGSQDDPINVHGTYLGVKAISGNRVWLNFCHPETWGWLPFLPGDEVCFVRRSDFKRSHSYHIRTAELLDAVNVVLMLDDAVSDVAEAENFVMENLSAYPDVSIHDCIFERYPTRGILMTSAGKCRIFNNEIRQTAHRPAIHIAADANSWYESGGVRDLEIAGNRFYFSTYTAINIDPELKIEAETPVHTNIRIHENTFEDCSGFYLRYHSADNLVTDLPPEKITKANLKGKQQ